MVNGRWSPLNIPGAVQGRLGGQGNLKVAVSTRNIQFFIVFSCEEAALEVQMLLCVG